MARTWSEEAGALAGRVRNRIEQLRYVAPLDRAHRPVAPVGTELGVDPVDVLLPGLFPLLAVPLDVLGGQIPEQHDGRGVGGLRGCIPGGPDAIAHGGQVHFGITPSFTRTAGVRRASTPGRRGARSKRSSCPFGKRRSTPVAGCPRMRRPFCYRLALTAGGTPWYEDRESPQQVLERSATT
jgi:hypothetical protein